VLSVTDNSYTSHIYKVLKESKEARKDDNLLIAKAVESKARADGKLTYGKRLFVKGLLLCARNNELPQMTSIIRTRRFLEEDDNSIIDEETYNKRRHISDEFHRNYPQTVIEQYFFGY